MESGGQLLENYQTNKGWMKKDEKRPVIQTHQVEVDFRPKNGEAAVLKALWEKVGVFILALSFSYR